MSEQPVAGQQQQTGGQQQNPQGQQTEGTGQQQQQQQQRAPYADYLEKIPEGLRGVVDPIFKEWDGNVTRKFQEYTNQIEGYKPYQPLFDQYEPDALQQAVSLAEQLSTQESAEQFFHQLAQVLGYDVEDQNNQQQQQQQQPNGFDPEPDIFADPRFQKLEQGIGSIAQQLQQQQQQVQMQQLQAQVEQEWEQQLEENKALVSGPDGNLNDDAVNMVLELAAANGGDIAKAFKTYGNAVGKQASVVNTPGQQAPIVGGGAQNTMPSNVVQPKNFTPQQRKEAALAVLRANNQQRQ